MLCLPSIILLSTLLAFGVVACLTNDCHADCIACWQLKGVIVVLKNGKTIKGYATWNDSWAELGYSSWNEKNGNSMNAPVKGKEKFPKVIFDSRTDIDGICIYTHLRSIKYPVPNALVAIREFIPVNTEEIKDLKLNPGRHDGYKGAGNLPLVSEKLAGLLQIKPVTSCHLDNGAGDEYWVSYDKSFPKEELKRLCDGPTDRADEEIQRLKTRDIFSLYYAYD